MIIPLSYIYLKDGWSHKKHVNCLGRKESLFGVLFYIFKSIVFQQSITITHDSSIFDNQINMKELYVHWACTEKPENI